MLYRLSTTSSIIPRNSAIKKPPANQIISPECIVKIAERILMTDFVYNGNIDDDNIEGAEE